MEGLRGKTWTPQTDKQQMPLPVHDAGQISMRYHCE